MSHYLVVAGGERVVTRPQVSAVEAVGTAGGRRSPQPVEVAHWPGHVGQPPNHTRSTIGRNTSAICLSEIK